MKYGLLADIHEAVGWLGLAIRELRARGAEHLIVLGDVFETGKHLDATVGLLIDAGAVGVWGNHDFGLCHEVSEFVRERFSPEIVDYMTTLQPELNLEDFLVTHVEPFRDPFNLYDLWSHEDDATLPLCFSQRDERLMFHGHHHRWKATRPVGPVDWHGETALTFEPGGRYLVQIAAVVDGRCALLDTSADLLTPIQLSREVFGRGQG